MDKKELHPMRVQRFFCRMSLDALAYKTGIDQARLSRIENGWKKPTPEQRQKIARALGVPNEGDIFPDSK